MNNPFPFLLPNFQNINNEHNYIDLIKELKILNEKLQEISNNINKLNNTIFENKTQKKCNDTANIDNSLYFL